MITDSLIRRQFVHSTIAEGVDRIFAAQQEAFTATFDSRTGRLSRMLSSHPWQHHVTAASYTATITMYAYLRFLDMQYRRPAGSKRRKRGLVYNKVVWPLLFREVFPELRYGFTDEVRRSLREDMEKALTIEH